MAAEEVTPWIAHAAKAIGVLTIYIIGLYVYRIYFSSLSKFPGPKLAAATLFYEGFFDLKKDGAYPWRIRDMHAKYGKYLSQKQ